MSQIISRCFTSRSNPGSKSERIEESDRERSRNVPWNQSLRILRSYRGFGLGGPGSHISVERRGRRALGFFATVVSSFGEFSILGEIFGQKTFPTIRRVLSGEGLRPQTDLPGSGNSQRRRGRMKAAVDNTGVKRTARAITLKENEIRAFRANELHGVKSFVMYGMSPIFAERFIPSHRAWCSG